jgi:biopolymer transport protein ExbD
MAASHQADEEPIYGINVTPLVDIMLVLLIIFMVAARLEAPQSVGVELPRGTTANETPPATLSIIVLREGELRLDGQTATIEEIESVVREAALRSRDAQAVVSADKGVAYERVIDVVDAIRRGGIVKLALAVDPSTKGG